MVRQETGYLDPGQGGGGQTCCLSIPSIWKPGMKATIVMDAVKNGKDVRVEKTVLVRQYSRADASMFVVNLFTMKVIRFFVTRYLLGHRKYPLFGKAAELQPGVPLKIIWE